MWTPEDWEKRAVEEAFKDLGDPYVWGEESDDAADCSGRIDNAARDAGHPYPTRPTAHWLWTHCLRLPAAEIGCLTYWLAKNGHAYHVAIAVLLDGPYIHTLGAHGGCSKVTSVELAAKVGARTCVKRTSLEAIGGYTAWRLAK